MGRRLFGFRLLLILGFLSSVAPAARGQEAVGPVRYDTSTVSLRRPAEGALQPYREDANFVYDRPPPGEGWWSQFTDWLLETILEPIGEALSYRAVRWLIYLIAAGLVLFALLRLLRMGGGGLFYRKKMSTPIDFEGLEGDIEGVDFEARIKEAIAARDYKRAIRLHYLKALKGLTAQDFIAWTPDKTNHEYAQELRPTPLYASFTALTYLFEYIWYGDFPVDAALFRHAEGRFTTFEAQLSGAGHD